MKKALIKAIIAVLITAIFMSAFTVVSSAASYKKVLVLGDSISTGYGLEGALYERPSYANKLATAINAESLINLAVDGATSSDLLNQLDGIEDEIAGKDLIIMSIGGNDMLRTTGKVLAEALGATSEMDLSAVLGGVSTLPAEEVAALFSSADVIAQYNEMVTTLGVNLKSIFVKIKSINPDARIIIFDQYNPFSGAEGSEALVAFDIAAESLITWMNGVIIAAAFEFGADICDAYTAFGGEGALYTRIMEMDIHPNEEGHALLAVLLENILDINDEPVPETSDSMPMILVGMVISGAGAVFFMKSKKKVRA